MDKIDKPRGLVKYASKEEIENGRRKIFSAKAIGYTVVLSLLFGLLVFLLTTRSDFELSILRTPGLMAQEQPDGRISNLFDMKIINKTFDEMSANLELLEPEGEIRLLSGDLRVQPHGYTEAKFFIILNKSQITDMTLPVKIAVKSNGKIVDMINSTFLGKVKGKP
jgi:polyferredoxin